LWGFDRTMLLVLASSAAVSVLGFVLIKQVFDRILSITNDAKLMAAGDLGYKTEGGPQDEVGDLRQALSNLSTRIRGNVDELKKYSEHSSEINIEMQRRMLIFSGLLQVSSMIAQAVKSEVILKAIVEKCRFLASSDVAFLMRREDDGAFVVKIAEGSRAYYLMNIRSEAEEDVFRKAVVSNKPLIIDRDNHVPEAMFAWFFERFRLKNTLAMPVYMRGKVVAILGVGNSKENFAYDRDDTEILDIFAKQVAISIENDMLAHRVEKLEIKDELTGLYNESFIRNRLQEEIRRSIAYQRPCGFVLLNVDGYQKYLQVCGIPQSEAVLNKAAQLIRDSVSEIDPVGRTDNNEFAIILPEKNKRHAQQVAEEIRKKIEFTFGEDPDPCKRITVSGGVSENPLDGISAEELIAKAKSSLNLAKMQGKNRILG
jgi:diguanylate cyclase (GGDEF)-like protein